MSETKKENPYELYLATAQNTGWPIDGHRMVFGIWNYIPNSYALMDWSEDDDEAVMTTFFQIEVENGLEDADGLEAFKKTWDAGEYEWPGAFHLDPDKVSDVEKIEKSPFVCKDIL